MTFGPPFRLSADPRLAAISAVRVRCAALGLALALLATPLAAQTAPQGESPYDTLLEKLDLKAKIAPAPDFVVKSRPAPGTTRFIPVGTPHPDRPVKVMTPAEVAATTADLDASRMGQQRRAGVKPLPVPLKLPKGAAKSDAKTVR